jgi:hypothetical protein
MKKSETQGMIQRGAKANPHHREHGEDGTENNRGIVYTTERCSITGDGFQSGYRLLSVRWNGTEFAQILCRTADKSSGLAAILASYS